MKNKSMQRAIELSIESINSGGGPFGSVTVSYTHLTLPTNREV